MVILKSVVGALAACLVCMSSAASEDVATTELEKLGLTADEFIAIAAGTIGPKGRIAIRREGAVFGYMIVGQHGGSTFEPPIVNYLTVVLEEVTELSHATFSATAFPENQIVEHMRSSANHFYIVFGHDVEVAALIEEANEFGPIEELKFPARDELGQNGPLIGAMQVWTMMGVAQFDHLPGCVIQYYRVGSVAIEQMFAFVSLDVDQRDQRECINAIVLKSLGILITPASLVANPTVSDGNQQLSNLARAIIRSFYSSKVELGDTTQQVRLKLDAWLSN